MAELASFDYHEVTDDPTGTGFQRPAARAFTLTPAAFRGHLDRIAAAGVTPTLVTALDLTAPGRHVCLTFDDGGRSALAVGDELRRRGYWGHFFVVTSLIGTRTFLSPAEVRYLRSCGHVVGSHSHTHPDIFRDLPRERMLEEWRVSADLLATLLGERCVAAAVPGGDISPVVLRSADAAGLRYLFTCEPQLRPVRVGECWVLGRFIPKVGTPPGRVEELVRFRGWWRARIVRGAKELARHALPPLYRAYVRTVTRPTQDVANPLQGGAAAVPSQRLK